MGCIEDVDDILNEAGVPHALLASTLLGIYRDGEPIDKIHEFAVLSRDIKEDTIDKIKSVHGHTGLRSNQSGLAIIDLKGLYAGNFEIHIIRFTKLYSYQNPESDRCLVWPKAVWLKKNWQKIKWHGRTYNAPMIEDYLRLYYGESWKTPQEFYWLSAPNVKTLKDLEGDINFQGEMVSPKSKIRFK